MIADVSGKGIPAALFMMSSMIMLSDQAALGISPAEILMRVNEAICANNREEMFVTVWLGILEVSTGRVTAANAGHEFPIISDSSGHFELFKDPHGFVIGGMDGMKYKEYEFTMEHGSRLFLYTDGVTEATDLSNELFGTDRLLEALNASGSSSSPEKTLHSVRDAISEFVGEEEPFDDVTMMIVELKTPNLSFRFENRGYDIIDIVNNKINDYYSYVDNKVLSEVNIIFDELLNNYVSYEKKENLVIEINIKLVRDKFIFECMNNGDEFNPLEKKDKKIETFESDMPIGGLGITIIKNMSSDISYERKDGKNILTIEKNIK